MIDYTAILTANYPGAQWSLNNNDYATLEWYSNTPKPTQPNLTHNGHKSITTIKLQPLKLLDVSHTNSNQTACFLSGNVAMAQRPLGVKQ